MSRNEHSFAFNPVSVDKPRSTFGRNSVVKTTFNSSFLVPFFLDEVLPGDTFDISTSAVVRMSTPIFPVADDAYLDTFYFFVPNRLVWDHWKELMGENTDSAWVSEITYKVPNFTYKGGTVGTLVDYFGFPVGDNNNNAFDSDSLGDLGKKLSALPLRGYKLIWNEWFRDQNLQDPVFINKSDTTDTYAFDAENGNTGLLPVCKFHDYYTSALPSPQRGQSVGLNLDKVAVYPSNDFDYTDLIDKLNVPLRFYNGLAYEPGDRAPLYHIGDSNDFSRTTKLTSAYSSGDSPELSGNDPIPYNLVADLSKSSFSVNDLRLAFQTQRVLELDARAGTRYNEMILAHFGTHVPDATVQRPEYLGGKRLSIRMNEVVQQSETDVTPLGNVAAFSKTTDQGHSFTKSFTEHGYIIGVLCVRQNHTYSQGINKLWTRQDRFDFYLPSFAFLGEQPVYNYEIYANGDEPEENERVFGYQEAWAEYRYKPSICTGYMRPYLENGLYAWSYADAYDSTPRLSETWIREDVSAIDRTLAVRSDKAHQFIADIYIENDTTRVMPVYSVPGLIDHF